MAKIDKSRFSNYYLEIVGLRQANRCSMCKKELPKGSVAFRRRQPSWARYCVDCGQEFCKKQIINLKGIIKNMKKTIKAVDDSRDNLTNLNMLAGLGDG